MLNKLFNLGDNVERNLFISKKLGNLNNKSILDLGCRDAVLAKHLQGNFHYTGVDFLPKEIDKKTVIINFNLENGIPDHLGKFDIITAIDVLEHLENIHQIFAMMLEKANQQIIIALPNMAYYKFRLNFLFKGLVSGKYDFSPYKQKDRHRWFPTYNEIDRFIYKNLNSNYKIKRFEYIAARKRNYFFYILEKYLSKIFPNLFVYELIYIIEKN